MLANSTLRADANLPAAFEMGEEELLTRALELHILRLYEQGDTSTGQAPELLERARRALGTQLSAGSLRPGEENAPN